ncbi:MAG: TetR/AcrR family transcriptional regulator [Bacillota bacterium]
MHYKGLASSFEGVPAAGTKDKILRVARDLIAEKGIHKTSLAAIAEKAGISRGTLFYYFPSKQSLLYQIMESSFQDVTDQIIGAIDAATPEDKPEAIIYLALSYIGEARSLNQTNFHLFQEAISEDEILKNRFQESYRNWQELIARHLQEYFPHTTAHTSPQIMSSLILAIIDGISIQALLDYAPVNYRHIARLIAGLFREDAGV